MYALISRLPLVVILVGLSTVTPGCSKSESSGIESPSYQTTLTAIANHLAAIAQLEGVLDDTIIGKGEDRKTDIQSRRDSLQSLRESVNFFSEHIHSLDPQSYTSENMAGDMAKLDADVQEVFVPMLTHFPMEYEDFITAKNRVILDQLKAKFLVPAPAEAGQEVDIDPPAAETEAGERQVNRFRANLDPL